MITVNFFSSSPTRLTKTNETFKLHCRTLEGSCVCAINVSFNYRLSWIGIWRSSKCHLEKTNIHTNSIVVSGPPAISRVRKFKWKWTNQATASTNMACTLPRINIQASTWKAQLKRPATAIFSSDRNATFLATSLWSTRRMPRNY